jgi:hypothetical protein
MMRGIWLPPVLGVLVAACGGEHRSATTRVDSAGVEIVTYAGPDAPLAWSFDSLFALGGAEAGEQSFYQLRGRVVGADAAGNLYVLDAVAKHIAVFDSSGDFMRAMGRAGGGPGELQWPIALVVAPDGRAGAFDIGKRGLVWFGPNGEILDQVPVTAGYRGGTIAATRAALVFAAHVLGETPEAARETDLLWVEGNDTLRMVTLPEPPGKEIMLKSCGMGMSGMQPVFAPTLRFAADGDRVAAAIATGYEFLLLTRGDTLGLIRRPLAPEPATKEAAVGRMAGGMRVVAGGGERVCDAEEVVAQRGMADHVPIIAEIAAGPDSTWWVRRDNATGVDVFTTSGDYLGSLPASAPYPALTLPGRRIASIVTDELDVDRLVVYRVRMAGKE